MRTAFGSQKLCARTTFGRPPSNQCCDRSVGEALDECSPRVAKQEQHQFDATRESLTADVVGGYLLPDPERNAKSGLVAETCQRGARSTMP